jgi:O-methyltransferase
MVMEFSLFQWINIALVGLLVILFIRYIIILYIERGIHPAEWENLKKNRALPAGLIRIERRYNDKARFHAWYLQVERLKQEKIPGAFAELGVYKGESAEILHLMDPDRDLHLFDTFSGFSREDLKYETGEAATYTPDHFADTSIQAVRDRFGPNAKLHFHPGHFPASSQGFKEPLALVNLDADLYQPTRAALNLFYPLLSPGGVIFIHDYNYKWPGIKQAVNEFLSSVHESPVLIPDNFGTVIIVKNR